ncbi:hypothetical protein, partial [Phascolarctobacterium succinatutens]|uniref:hypothetical protein n=1 Tax=Phascolarctobacterium succinatutens TaxID=626940 RepID=UPI003AB7C2F2
RAVWNVTFFFTPALSAQFLRLTQRLLVLKYIKKHKENTSAGLSIYRGEYLPIPSTLNSQ